MFFVDLVLLLINLLFPLLPTKREIQEGVWVVTDMHTLDLVYFLFGFKILTFICKYLTPVLYNF